MASEPVRPVGSIRTMMREVGSAVGRLTRRSGWVTSSAVVGASPCAPHRPVPLAAHLNRDADN